MRSTGPKKEIINQYLMLRWILIYCAQVLAASIAGALAPVIFFFLMILRDSSTSSEQVWGAALFMGAVCLIMIILPFCFFVAAPAAILIHRYFKMTLPRILLLAILLTAPGIVLLDYQMHLSSGKDSGPPEDPYTLSHLLDSISFGSDFCLMVVIPLTSSLLAAMTLWYLRFRICGMSGVEGISKR
ncbi:MAG: hypothetical protein DCC75_02250 [Proteobacteria bacterium]|nr:MAG: hypothetical protein DCC75_02250 [Pseudomonadota bacterium]